MAAIKFNDLGFNNRLRVVIFAETIAFIEDELKLTIKQLSEAYELNNKKTLAKLQKQVDFLIRKLDREIEAYSEFSKHKQKEKTVWENIQKQKKKAAIKKVTK